MHTYNINYDIYRANKKKFNKLSNICTFVYIIERIKNECLYLYIKMTASSVDFFPCRVQLLGLPKSTSLAAATNITTRPPISKIQRVSRNLFGVPDQDEMKTFYQQEAERMRSYVLERYSFNTSILEHTSEQELKQLTDNIHTSQNETIHAMQPTQFPTLIEQEICKHEQRLQDETHSLNRPSTELTPTNEGMCNLGRIPFNGARKNFNSLITMSNAIERFKPYSRQSLLKGKQMLIHSF